MAAGGAGSRREISSRTLRRLARESRGDSATNRLGAHYHRRRGLRRGRDGLHARHGDPGAREQQVANIRLDRAILTTTGTRPWQGSINKQEAAVILGLPGGKKCSGCPDRRLPGAWCPSKVADTRPAHRIHFPLVGVTAALSDFALEMHFTAGRPFKSGLSELVASNACTRQFVGLRARRQTFPSRRRLDRRRPLRPGTRAGLRRYADADTLTASTFSRTTYSSAALMLDRPRTLLCSRRSSQRSED